MNIHLATLGCKLNESEIEAWARQCAREGYTLVDDVRVADVIVVNTCTVTHVAARKTRQLTRQLARANPRAHIVLTGCFVTISPNDARALPNVALVIPNATKDQLIEQVAKAFSDQRSVVCSQQSAVSNQRSVVSGQRSTVSSQDWLDADVETQIAGHESPISHLQSPTLRTRAFVKIQDGCNLACAYCIIPRARGAERSRPHADILAEVRALVDAGYKEIVLTGVQISAYAPSLRDLVAAILAETDVPRLRLTSIAPWDVDDALLDLWRDARLCRHVHLSLQSGCDATLRRMRRPYTTAQFARVVERVRARIPDVGITTDVIVGFPGETDAEFEQSLHFVEQMQFSRVHVFPYSKREGTHAATLPNQISDAVKQARAKEMQAVADASQRAFAARFVGRELVVLWETKTDDERRKTKDERPSSFVLCPSSFVWSGYSDNYIRVVATSEHDLHNRITAARVIELIDDGVIAIIGR